jgi:hypothetical protein
MNNPGDGVKLAVNRVRRALAVCDPAIVLNALVSRHMRNLSVAVTNV